jgi:DNA-binding LacI/PurR family transcriptional regulator
MLIDNDTNLPVSPDAPLPRYEQIKKAIINYIQQYDLKPKDKLPTEAELCRQFGWSRPTISRALNELAMEGILTRIQGSGTYVAEKKIPDRPFRIMISNIALKSQSEYSAPIFAGIREVAAQEGLDIQYYQDAAFPDPENVIKSNVDGILILAPNVEDMPSILKLKETGKPVVAMAHRSRFGLVTTICTDNYDGLRQAVNYLAGLGHRRIALVTPGINSSDVQERIMGFNQACFEAGIRVDPAYLLLFSSQINSSVLEAWLDSLSSRPTAIICNNGLAFPIQHLLWSRNLKVPQDISLIVTDDSELFQNCVPELTVIRQPLKEMGRQSLLKLLQILHGQDQGKPEVLPNELIIRNSCAPVQL